MLVKEATMEAPRPMTSMLAAAQEDGGWATWDEQRQDEWLELYDRMHNFFFVTLARPTAPAPPPPEGARDGH
jgi:phage pi2 protein 07